MARLVDWIKDLAADEAVEAVVLGADEGFRTQHGQPQGVVLSWEEAVPHLQYEFHEGLEHGGCNAFTAWTKSWVIAVARHGDSLAPFRLPRVPTEHAPRMPGW